MSRKNPRMTPPTSRKKLLVAESELNRTLLVRDVQLMTDNIQALSHQAKTIGSLASMAVSLMSWFQRPKIIPTTEKPSWLQTLLQGAQMAGSLWSKFAHQPNN